MGSFNLTCSASKQTIAPGDACYLVGVARNMPLYATSVQRREQEVGPVFGDTSTECYTGGIWEPRSGLIAGEYDDYGNLLISMDPVNMLLVAQLMVSVYKDGLVTKEASPNEDEPTFDFRAFIHEVTPGLRDLLRDSHKLRIHGKVPADLAVDILSAWNYLWNGMRRGLLFTHQYGQVTPMRFAVFHEAAVDGLCDVNAQRANLAPEQVFARAILKACEHVSDFLHNADAEDLQSVQAKKWLRARVASLGAGRALELVVDAADINSDAARSIIATAGITFESAVKNVMHRMGDGEGGGHPLNSIQDRCLRALFRGEMDREQCYKALNPVIRYLSLTGGMQRLNLKFEPSQIAGQDRKNQIGEEYANFIAQTSRKVSESHRDVNDFDDLPRSPRPAG